MLIKTKRLNMSNNRRDITETEKMFLLSEIGGICPLCHTALIIKKASGKEVRIFDIAHIYPLNPTSNQLEILKYESKLSEDLDSQANMIPLCKICHKRYDTNLTSEEYQQLFNIKKNVMYKYELRQTWGGYKLHSDILQVVTALSSLDSSNMKPKISYSIVNIDNKIDSTLGNLEKMKIQSNIIMYYSLIFDSFKQIEQKNECNMMQIYAQVRSYCCTLLSQGFDQKEIVDEMVEWFMHSANLDNRVKAEILVAFFVQNCEVFSDANSK